MTAVEGCEDDGIDCVLPMTCTCEASDVKVFIVERSGFEGKQSSHRQDMSGSTPLLLSCRLERSKDCAGVLDVSRMLAMLLIKFESVIGPFAGGGAATAGALR